MPLPPLFLFSLAYTDTHIKIFHPKKPTNTLATLRHPARLEWQGQRVGDDNMAAVISSAQSFGPERHEVEAVSREEATRV